MKSWSKKESSHEETKSYERWVIFNMNNLLKLIQKEVYIPYNLTLSNLQIEDEGREYNACNFKLNNLKIINRNSKITPKKVGPFVTFWNRSQNGITQPFHENDDFDFYVINVKRNENIWQFVFPKSILIEKSIVSSTSKDWKRGFRVYPSWDITTNKQAQRTQGWQLKYFYTIDESIDIESIKNLYWIT